MTAKRLVAPALVMSVGFAVSGLLLRGQPAARQAPPTPEPPAVRFLTLEQESIQLRVRSQGNVSPRTESDLVAEVPGRVLRVESGLEPGAFFRKGELLALLDPRDLELQVGRAGAALTRARAEEEYAEATLARQLALRREGIASDAVVDETRRAARTAEARRLEAELDLERAERDLERTRIVAPFDGRTRARDIDVGRFVSVGTPLARLYAVDYAEVRLPVPDRELAYLDLPLGQEVAPDVAPEVELRARFAGREHRWSARVVRTEAEIDPRTRMVGIVARVARPYEPSGGAPPLAAGLFGEAEILGRRVDGVFRVPRAALADDDSVWLVDADDRLRRRRVEVLRLERDAAIVSAGLSPHERVSLLEPRLSREGLVVRAAHEESLARHDGEPEPAS